MVTATRPTKVKQLEGFLAGRRWDNHPHALRVIQSKAKRKIVCAGRQSSKTTIAAKLTCEYFGRCLPVLYLVPTAEQLSRWWFEVKLLLRPLIDNRVVKVNETEHTITVPGTEQQIKGKTAWDSDSARGGNWALIIYDEWQLMDEDTHKVVGDPMLLKWDGDAIFIYTPPSLRSRSRSKARDPRHAAKLYKEHEHDTDGVWECFHFTSLDNPNLPRVSLDRIAQDMTREDYRKEILAEDDDLELTRLVYAAFKDSQWIAPFDIPKKWLCHSWHDFGQANPAALFVAQNNDKTPFSLSEGGVVQPGDCVIFHAYLPGAGKSTAWHVAQFEDIVEGRKMSVRVGGNPNTEDEIRQGYGAHGWPIKAPRWTRPKEQIARTIAHMEKGRLWAFNTLHNLREEMANMLWETDDEGYRLDKIQNEPRYHLSAALRYGASELALEVPLGRKVTPVTYL